MVRLTDRPAMTLDVNRGRKTTTQQQQLVLLFVFVLKETICMYSMESKSLFSFTRKVCCWRNKFFSLELMTIEKGGKKKNDGLATPGSGGSKYRLLNKLVKRSIH